MQIQQFKFADGRVFEGFGSSGVRLTPLFRDTDNLLVTCLCLDPNGIIGSHEAPTDQLLIVVNGDGFVCAGESQLTPVKQGAAVFWHRGETHETRAGENGLTIIIIEGEALKPKETLS